MISTHLYGRLGNQLFQLSATIAYALRHDIAYCIPGHITCPPGLSTDPIYFNHFLVRSGISEHLLPEWKERADQAYMEIPAALSGSPFILNGYFQSEKYFADQRERVIKELKVYPLKTIPDLVAIHVRRGDYLQDDKKGKHPVQTMDYYRSAINYFYARKGLKYFHVFSDDIAWCIENFNKRAFCDCHFAFERANNPAVQALELMTSCNHFIIANSSFSWWGAWLAKAKDKTVIAPKNWYGPELSHIDTKDLLPERWITI